LLAVVGTPPVPPFESFAPMPTPARTTDAAGDEFVMVSVNVLVFPTGTLPNVTLVSAKEREGPEVPGVLRP